MSIDDWRYSDQKMKVREQALKVLFAKFGAELEGVVPKYSNQSIYECAQDWVSQGNMHTAHCRDCKILRGILCKK